MNRSIIRWLLLGLVVLSFSVASFGQVAVGISVRFGPPPLPVYAQPICPGSGYIWTPGYWAWNDMAGYYWVPGTWVFAPVGMLWTPGYWGWGGGFYVWHPGYWGPHVGFYGGINYGYGYPGAGFYGGEWRHGGFYYNRSVTNVSVTNVTNVYNRTVIVNNRSTTSFNGGNGGIQARPTHNEEKFARERHTAALEVQNHHEREAATNRQNFASENHGRPVVAATARPGDFGSHSVVPARAAGGEYHAPAMSPREARVGAPGEHRNPEGFRPFTPPTKGTSSPGSDRNVSPNSGHDSPYNQNPHNDAGRHNEQHTQHESHGSPQPHESPRMNQQPAPSRPTSPPPPQKQSPPHGNTYHGKRF